MIWTVLYVDRERVFPRRRDGRIEGALGDDLEPGMLGGSAVLGVEKRVLDVVDRGSDVCASPMMRSGRPVGRGPPGELRQCAVDFHRRSVHLDRADGTPKFRGTSSGSSIRRSVGFGSAFETTAFASIVLPPSSRTPAARPPRTRIRSTGERRRISTPWARAAAARASGSAPIPPSTSPQPPTWPSMFPRRLCASVNAVPGAEGPEK